MNDSSDGTTRDGSTPDHADAAAASCEVQFSEMARLAALRSFGVLDTAPENDYDDLTRLAAAICHTPMALISLVDEDRQWFKSRLGLEAQETPLSLSFCRHALARPDEIMMVPDARKDARFQNHPLVVGEPHIRFYAGAPLVTDEGFALGTLCVIDFVPRELADAQCDALKILARQVMTQLELRRALRRADENAAGLEKVNAWARSLLTEVHDLYDNAPVGYHSLDADGMIQRMNQTELRWLGYAREEVVGKMHFTQILAPTYRAAFEPNYARFKRSDAQTTNAEFELLRKDGGSLFCYLSASAVRDAEGKLIATRSSVFDISELKRTTQALRESEARFKAFMDHGPAVTFIKDENGCYLYANPTLLERFGKTWSEFIGHRDQELWPSETYQKIQRNDRAVLKNGKVISSEETAPLPDGSTSCWLSFKFPLQGGDGRRLLGGISVDITELKDKERQLADYQERLEEVVSHLEEIAVTDSLTGLKNHGAFMERLHEEVERAHRYDTPLSLVMFDVDFFKTYNDAFGHPAGDDVLRRVGEILSSCARPSDFSARYGGEEFAVILTNTPLAGALAHAERIRHEIEVEPWPRRAVTISVGVAALSPENADAGALIGAADIALYKAKRTGRNRVAQ